MQGLLLHVNQWDLTDEKTGEKIAGATGWAMLPTPESTDSAQGIKPFKFQIPRAVVGKYLALKLPCICEFGFSFRSGANSQLRPLVTLGEPGRLVELFGKA